MRSPPLSPSIQECLVETARRLHQVGIPDSQHEAYELLEHVTGRTLTSLMCSLQQQLDEHTLSKLEHALERRLHREPLQHITGTAWFYGREFHVDRRVLVPRQETELLVDRVVTVMAEPGKPVRILDVGTGSGILAVTLACELERARIDATDVSVEAIQVARKNIRFHGVESRVNLVLCDLGGAFRRVYDVIVANLPYVPTLDIGSLQPEVSQWDPVVALDGGAHGLATLERMVAQAPGLLHVNGLLCLEVGAGQAEVVHQWLSASGRWHDSHVERDLAGIPRIVWARLAG